MSRRGDGMTGYNLPPGVTVADIEDQQGTLDRKFPPIFASGVRVRLSKQVAGDPACKVTDFVGYTGIVRYMIPNERGEPCEWCAVFFPHRNGTSIWHADALEEADPK